MTPERMFIKPREGFTIHDPERRDFLPATGRSVRADDLHWHRLLRDGDVVLTEPPAEETPAPQSASKEA